MKLAADEDFDGRVLRGLARRTPEIEIVRLRDVGLDATKDPQILAWAAAEGRALLSHDVNTMTGFAVRRLRAGELMAGLVIVPQTEAVGRVIDSLIELLGEHHDTGFEGQIVYLKL